MDEITFDYSDSLRRYAHNWGTRWDKNGNPIEPDWLKKFVLLTDRDFSDARKILNSFSGSYGGTGGGEHNNTGWSKIREYKNPNTIVDFVNDKTAPNSVIVKRYFQVSDGGVTEILGESFYWISNKKGKYGEPLIYVLIDPDDDKPVPYTHRVSCVNFNWGDRETFENGVSIFSCRNNYLSDQYNEFEMWKKGKSLPELKSKKGSKNLPLRELQLVPIPVNR